MSEPSQKLIDVDFIVTRIGLPAVILGVVMWFFFHEFNAFRKELAWDMQRSIRNERSIMQKLDIPMVLDNERPGENK